jgi:hypothetical protein
MSTDLYRHAANLGMVMVNLQSLEFVLRMFLLEVEGNQSGINYHQLSVGDQIIENAFSNWDTLGELVAKYNDRIKPVDCSLCIDDSVIELRDALAHGRVSAPETSLPLRLLKFTKPRDGQVEVSFADLMDETWFQEQCRLTHDQAEKVAAASKCLGMKAFRDVKLG